MSYPIKSYTEQLEIANSIHLVTKLNVCLIHNKEIILSLDNTYNYALFSENLFTNIQSIEKQKNIVTKRIKNEFLMEYLVTKIPYSSAVECFLIIGPFVCDIFSQSDLLTIVLENNLSFEDKNRLEQAYRSLHMLTNEEIHAIEFLLLNLLNNKEQIQPTYHTTNYKEPISYYESFIAPEKDIKSIEERYKEQYHLKKVIQKGDIEKAKQCSNKYNHFFLLFKNRVEGNYLRAAKNTAIVGNVSNRLAAEEAGVHPKYLDDISEKYAVQIEKTKTVDEIITLSKEMIVGYTRLVQTYTYHGYSPLIKKILNYIHLHLTENLSLDDLAKELEMNKTYLCKKFKDEIKMTISDYINSERIKEGKTMLTQSDISLSEIAYLLGYNDYSYFSKIFKKKTGLSPGAFITQHKNGYSI
ncbi:helix-turn-helix domain-containing protein [Listeria monocytogenes]|uniref:helix-turn-helix domain-containing protein n=1 Tax=Listeria monocytogenes TaxID=1639 RepID=UPI000873716E|nr:AraC family transcriptional regulator [Listeria monocytogenes]EAC7182535.1 AraC family transcriptional regulator [Listeria monocytogenes]EAC8000825.1 AraC family transcriptional regulator [Listeria monocytogenes]EAC8350983.1 AraC family transcriptional regulator [Listeria monocytogenes]EAC9519289.1 AraC family transcriptional regulator [Listeria monocytogenes]EAD4096256.1 AraC family transcriptional regulator [Listeria monocytogenes]